MIVVEQSRIAVMRIAHDHTVDMVETLATYAREGCFDFPLSHTDQT
ncbi:hypothetical protein MCERH10_00938 [Caulobacteraceae bacterium]